MDQGLRDAHLQGTRVELRFPGAPEFLRLARLATADAGGRAGLDVDAIEDLRIAVSELCALIGGPDIDITLSFDCSPGSILVEGRGGSATLDGENAEMAQALVRALVDEYELEADVATTRFSIRKHTPA